MYVFISFVSSKGASLTFRTQKEVLIAQKRAKISAKLAAVRSGPNTLTECCTPLHIHNLRKMLEDVLQR